MKKLEKDSEWLNGSVKIASQRVGLSMDDVCGAVSAGSSISTQTKEFDAICDSSPSSSDIKTPLRCNSMTQLVQMDKMVLTRAAAIVGVFLLMVSSGSYAQSFQGEGRAVLGSGMTPNDAKELAFQYARKEALEKFGSYVVSEQNLVTKENEDGVSQTSEKRISVIAAGKASLVEESKEVSREATEETIVYTVRADFKMSDSAIDYVSKAYAEYKDNSALREAVDRAVKTSEEAKSIEEDNASSEGVRQVISRIERSYREISDNIKELDGKSVKSKIQKRRLKKGKPLMEYIRKIKEGGFPRDMIEMGLERINTYDKGERVTIEYKASLNVNDRFGDIRKSCYESVRKWAPILLERPSASPEEWIDDVISGDLEYGIPVSLIVISKSRNVMIMKTPYEIDDEDTGLNFDYTWCEKIITRGGTYAWKDTWRFDISTEALDKISKVGLIMTNKDYERAAKRSGLTELNYNTYVNESGVHIKPSDIAIGRKTFNNTLDGLISRLEERVGEIQD